MEACLLKWRRRLGINYYSVNGTIFKSINQSIIDRFEKSNDSIRVQWIVLLIDSR